MALDTIKLNHVLPEVFANNTAQPHSEVWLRDVTFTRGSVTLVEAESGTGKSSLCSFIYGNRHDYRGSILFNGIDIATFSINHWCKLRRTSLALLPQEMRLFPELTVMENIVIKNRLTNCKTMSEIHDMLARLEIDHKADVTAARLSVGQQQRVAIVRALCQPFDFLLLDEPVSHLDARNNLAVSQIITDEAHSRGAGIIATSVGYAIDITPDRKLQL